MELDIHDLIERIYFVVEDERYYTLKFILEDGLLYEYAYDGKPDYDDDCYKILCDCVVDEIHDSLYEEYLIQGIKYDTFNGFSNEMDEDGFNKVYIDKVTKAIEEKLKEEYTPRKINYPTYIERDDEMIETGEFVTGEVTYTFHNYGKHIEIKVSLDID